MDPKSIFASKTFWFAILFVLLNIAGVFGYETYQADPELVNIVGLVVSALVIALRFITKQAIG
jgi:hypothetical protein